MHQLTVNFAAKEALAFKLLTINSEPGNGTKIFLEMSSKISEGGVDHKWHLSFWVCSAMYMLKLSRLNLLCVHSRWLCLTSVSGPCEAYDVTESIIFFLMTKTGGKCLELYIGTWKFGLLVSAIAGCLGCCAALLGVLAFLWIPCPKVLPPFQKHCACTLLTLDSKADRFLLSPFTRWQRSICCCADGFWYPHQCLASRLSQHHFISPMSVLRITAKNNNPSLLITLCSL